MSGLGRTYGLAQAAMMPDRFQHLVIMNTWLHHSDYEYSEGIRRWNKNWHEGGNFHRPKPDFGLMMLMTAGMIGRSTSKHRKERGAARFFAGRLGHVQRLLSAIQGFAG